VDVRLGTRPSFISSRGKFLVSYKEGVLVGLHGTSPSRITREFLVGVRLHPSLYEYPGFMPDKPPSTL
jgi:hypothetical protein